MSSWCAAQTDQDAFARGLYQEYLQRAPEAFESQQLADALQQGLSADQLHANFISGDAIYQRYGNDNTSWLRGIFLALNNRQPTPAELQYWLNRLAQYGGDRRRLAEEFIRTYSGNRPWPPTRPPTSTDLSTLSQQLISDAKLLSQSIDQEFTGTTQRVLKMKANNLIRASIGNGPLLRNADRVPDRAWSAHDNLRKSLDAVQQGLAQSPAARDSRRYAQSIDQTLWTIASVLPPAGTGGGGPIYPPLPPTTDFPGGLARLTQRTSELNASVMDLSYLLSALARQDYRWRGIALDVEAYAREVDAFRQGLNGYNSLQALQDEGRQLRQSARRLHRTLTASPDMRVIQGWQQVLGRLNTLLAELEINGGIIDGTQPPTVPDIDRREIVVRAIDNAITSGDSLDQALVPYRLRGAAVQQFLVSWRSLRRELLTKRANVSSLPNLVAIQNDMRSLNPIIVRMNAQWPAVLGVTDPRLDAFYKNLSLNMQAMLDTLR